VSAEAGSRPLVFAAVAVALVLRLPRVIARWDEIALAYAAYAAPAMDAVGAVDVRGGLTAWVGLHPPVHALLLGLIEHVYPAPLLWLLLSAALSVAAVGVVARLGGPLAGLALAVAPLQLAYAAEVNNYPLAICAMALLLAAARARWPWLVAAAALACGSHVLGAAAAGGVVAWRLVRCQDPRARLPLAAGATLVAMPVVVGAIRLMGQDSTWGQPADGLEVWLGRVVAGVGPGALVLWALGLAGLRGPALAAFAAAVGLLGTSLALGAAAPHQLPYLALLEVPLAVGLGTWVARAGRSRWMAWVAGGVLVLLLSARAVTESARDLAALYSDQTTERGIDRVLSAAAPGDTVWLVAPALQADDDKAATSAVLWRIRPWSPMPMARPVAFDFQDWRYGQPRTWRGLTVHTSTELAEAPFDHIAVAALDAGARVWVVLYEHGPAAGLEDRVTRALRPYTTTRQPVSVSSGLGDDLVWRLDGVAP
jgi:hypothetical protein